MTPDQLIDAVRLAERTQREARGLPGDHVLTLAEFPFAFALDAVEQFDRVTEKTYAAHPEIGLLRAMARLAKKDYGGANDILGAYQAYKPEDPKGAMRFGLPVSPTAVPLPPVHGEYPREAALFLCCDERYFRTHCIPLLSSVAANSLRSRLHIHLMDGDPAPIEAVLKTGPLNATLTHEQTGRKGHDYYGAMRLVRFAEALEVNPERLWICDVDGLVMGKLDPLFSLRAPAAMRVRPGRLEPWNQFSACLVMGSPGSLSYFRTVADILKASLATPWWGIDQYALFAAWLLHKPDIQLLGPDIAAVDDAPGLLWFTAGSKKYELAAGKSNYARAYLRYAASA